jgi:hypothetical protein
VTICIGSQARRQQKRFPFAALAEQLKLVTRKV